MMLAFIAVFLPLAGAVMAFLAGHRAKDRIAQAVTCLGTMGAFLASIFVLRDAYSSDTQVYEIAPWISSAGLNVTWSLRVDFLSALMFFVVNAVSSFVHIYAVGYMKSDKSIPRFMAYLSLFTFFMLFLVASDNLLQMFFGWEGVGLCSYLLIGFWFEKPSASAAGLKAFLVNRVGDFGFLLGILASFAAFGTLSFDLLFLKVTNTEPLVVSAIALLLFMGAMGKSAQLGLHVWLPDAMEGPTPVSALIHAATMVTAGVFMVARLEPLYAAAPQVLGFIAIVGATTALMAALMGLVQNDIKRVIAYSTMSQLGYMFFALGVGAAGAAIFHLFTHAFFKALLFLGAGSVIHGAGGEQDLRKMGGLRRKMPVTYAMMWIGSLSLMGVGLEGVYGFSGFYSKDLILAAARESGGVIGIGVYVVGLLTALLTALYSGRLILMAFHGEAKEHQGHEASVWMTVPMAGLAVGALFAGIIGVSYVKEVQLLHGVEAYFPLLCAILGLGVAVFLYGLKNNLLTKISTLSARPYRVLINGFYFDAIYNAVFVRGMQRLGKALWHRVDVGVIDRFGPDGVSRKVMKAGRDVVQTQTGFVVHYAFTMMSGLVLIVTYFWLRG